MSNTAAEIKELKAALEETRSKICLVLLVAGLILLAVTNPGQGDHFAAMRSFNKQKHPFLSVFEPDFSVFMQYHNYLFFSTTTLKGERGTFGILGMVFTTQNFRSEI